MADDDDEVDFTSTTMSVSVTNINIFKLLCINSNDCGGQTRQTKKGNQNEVMIKFHKYALSGLWAVGKQWFN